MLKYYVDFFPSDICSHNLGMTSGVLISNILYSMAVNISLPLAGYV